VHFLAIERSEPSIVPDQEISVVHGRMFKHNFPIRK